MTTFVLRGGKLVPKSEASRLFDGPQVISDDLKADLEHMAYADGRRTASKSQFRRWTREAGCVEKGNDREQPRPAQSGDIRADVGRALQMLREGYRPRLMNIEGD